MGSKLTVILSGVFARVPGQAGLDWLDLQYLAGLRRLGHDVILVEPVRRTDLVPKGAALSASDNAAYFQGFVRRFGLEGSAALLLAPTGETVGISYESLRARAQNAGLLVNMAGGLDDNQLVEPIPTRLYLDLDPGFTQLWHDTEGIDMGFGGHTHFATVGLMLGRNGCPLPTCGIEWIPTLPPVVLDQWPYANGTHRDALTTIANWRGYGSVEADGVFYGQKAHSMRRFIDLPRRVGVRFDLALAIDPGEPRDLSALELNGWNLINPQTVAGSPEQYREFIQGSRGEFGIAKSGYVEGRCGWFSDRSVCYLASGRPVIAQDTGFGGVLPTGQGLFAFQTVEDVEAAIDEMSLDYKGQRRAARAIAEEYFDSDVVLPKLLSRIGVTA